MRKLSADVPHLTVTTTSSPDSLMDEGSSPTMNLGSSKRLATGAGRMSLLRTTSSSTMEISEDEITPTKGGGSATVLAAASSLKTPTPSPGRPTNLSRSLNAISSVAVPRLSLPTVDKQQTKAERRRQHRQSMPLGPIELPEEEQDIFDSRFIPHGPIGRGAFSTVLKAEARDGSGTFAVKITRGVFDGVKDR
jgi:mitosis inhibitor protein kinase SWE1